jgi:hypothetical protein
MAAAVGHVRSTRFFGEADWGMEGGVEWLAYLTNVGTQSGSSAFLLRYIMPRYCRAARKRILYLTLLHQAWTYRYNVLIL